MSKGKSSKGASNPGSRRIIYVPGKNIKPSPDVHQEQLWRCLLNGVAREHPGIAREMQQQSSCFSMAPWNYTFYGRHGSLEKDIPWIDKLIAREGPTPDEKKEAGSWHKTVTKLMYAIGDQFHSLIKWIPDPRVKAMIADTTPYFGNHDGIADRIRATVKNLLLEADANGERVLLIGHSMGSVIAYEALWQLTHDDRQPCGVDLFLTLGSPLGMNYVQKHLLGMNSSNASFPRGIAEWENVSAVGDLISVDEEVHTDFKRMLKLRQIRSIRDHANGVYNWFRNEDGLNVHRSFGYLVNPLVGNIVANWWCNADGSEPPRIVAHRGYPSRYPENTMLGYEQALHAGAKFVELDVQLTQDRIPLVYHDADTSRVSGVPGSIFDLTLDDVKGMEASVPERFGEQYKNNPVATLEQFAGWLQGGHDVTAFVEIKSESIERFGVKETVDRVVQAISPIINRSVVISFHDECIEYTRQRYGMKIGWVLPSWDQETRQRAYMLSPEFLFVWVDRLPDATAQLWQGPWHWAVYVVDEATSANQYPPRGIRYVETDKIGEILADPELNR